MEVKVSLEIVIYVIISILCVIWIVANYLREDYGDYFSKRKYEFGLSGLVAIVTWIVYTLIWGGIFWW